MVENIIKSESIDLQVYFSKNEHSINSYTLASILVSLTDAIKETNKIINPGYDVEVIVVTFDDGSFKAILKTIYKKGKNLFSNQAVQAIVLGVVSSFIYDQFLAKKPEMKIEVSSEYVVVSTQNERVVIPKNIYEAKKQIENIDKVKQPIDKTICTLKKDDSITGFGLSDDIGVEPKVLLDRVYFDNYIPMDKIVEESKNRIVVENCKVEILRAIMRNSKRKWEFVWHGTEISAPIIDEDFYKRFKEHKYTIAPGDTFDVELKIIQERHGDTSIFINKSYEVVKVFGHESPADKNVELIEEK
jgi:hypothetical protein